MWAFNFNKPEYAEQLVNFGIALEQRLFARHFREDAANAPNVNA
jgi:hypothetical protein